MLVLHGSALVALFDPTNAAHEECSEVVESGPLLIAPHLGLEGVDRRLKARGARPLSHHVADAVVLGEPRPIRFEHPLDRDWLRIQEIEAEHDFDVADAFVVALAERLGATRIVTFDRRFADVRPNHVDAFELLPDV
jgi:predicted nucleic acid-binding protein